jgi:hypothetical protein
VDYIKPCNFETFKHSYIFIIVYRSDKNSVRIRYCKFFVCDLDNVLFGKAIANDMMIFIVLADEDFTEPDFIKLDSPSKNSPFNESLFYVPHFVICKRKAGNA